MISSNLAAGFGAPCRKRGFLGVLIPIITTSSLLSCKPKTAINNDVSGGVGASAGAVANTNANEPVTTGGVLQAPATGLPANSSTAGTPAITAALGAAVPTLGAPGLTQAPVAPVSLGNPSGGSLPGGLTGSTAPTITLGQPASGGAELPGAIANASGANTMPVSVSGNLCGAAAGGLFNLPCVTITLCQHGTSNCQTINDVLIDTGSSGLRLFATIVTVPTVPVAAGGAALAECIVYSGNSSEWGPVVTADLKMGGEPATQVPLQLIAPNYASPPAACTSAQSTPDSSPQEAGINGVLGLGLAGQDCGSYCATTTANGQYYSCSGSTCTAAATSVQVTNPVALLPTDNNGIIMQLPGVPATGAPSVNGTIIFGIGTQANNTPPPLVTAYAADPTKLLFSTLFNSQTIQSFIDSGSPLLVIPTEANLPACTGAQVSGLLCPPSPATLSAANIGNSGATGPAFTFEVVSAANLVQTPNHAFATMAQDLKAGGSFGSFDWGLPFFFGRSVYVGLEGKSSTLGAGPLWAY